MHQHINIILHLVYLVDKMSSLNYKSIHKIILLQVKLDIHIILHCNVLHIMIIQSINLNNNVLSNYINQFHISYFIHLLQMLIYLMVNKLFFHRNISYYLDINILSSIHYKYNFRKIYINIHHFHKPNIHFNHN